MIRRKRLLTGRVLVTVLVVALSAVSASAYTIVMRDGRRVEIPNDFTMSNSTLTYEVSNGIQVTVQLNTVDVAATERANSEASGAFLRRSTVLEQSSETAQPQRAAAQRSITNADLETFRRARVEGERSRKELGLPSLEDRRREVTAIQERTIEQVRTMRQQQQLQDEAEWRRRAELFRTQMEFSAAPVNFDGRRFDDSFGGTFFPFDGFGFGTSFGGFGRFGRLPVSLFPGFLSTPITPFPSIRPLRRPLLFTPRTRINPRPIHRRNH